MNKKTISVLLGIFMGLMFFTYAFAQKEKEVMKRYDYSSPKASFESLKKAIKEKDIEGVLIHQWQMVKLAEDTPAYGMSFEDFVTFTTQEASKGIMPPKVMILYLSNELEPANPGRLRITDLDFVKEKDREHDAKAYGVGVTRCWLILERKSDGEQFSSEACAENYDGTNEWWIMLSPSGE
jgi:superfamily I DNA/RNA helicase